MCVWISLDSHLDRLTIAFAQEIHLTDLIFYHINTPRICNEEFTVLGLGGCYNNFFCTIPIIIMLPYVNFHRTSKGGSVSGIRPITNSFALHAAISLITGFPPVDIDCGGPGIVETMAAGIACAGL